MRFPGMSGASTDGNGEYNIEGLEPADTTVSFQKEGFSREVRSVKLSAKETRLDARLSRGRVVGGLVVNESGTPVEGATIIASSAAQNAEPRSARSDAGGIFKLEGLSSGRYNFSAHKNGYLEGTLNDVDIDTVGDSLRITLKNGGSIYGHVAGLKESELATATVMAFGSGTQGSSPVDSSGNYRIDAAPIGDVRLMARIGGPVGSSRSGPSRTVRVEPGGQVQADLEFDQSTVIRGRVTREGKATTSSRVMFFPSDVRVQANATTLTDNSGNYEVSGLQDGAYEVRVMDMSRFTTYQTSYSVHGSATFDIDIQSGGIRGTVTDDTGAPLSGAKVVMDKDHGNGRFSMGQAAVTDAGGNFLIDQVSAGSYRARAEKSGYGQQVLTVEVGATVSANLDFKLHKEAGRITAWCTRECFSPIHPGRRASHSLPALTRPSSMQKGTPRKHCLSLHHRGLPSQ